MGNASLGTVAISMSLWLADWGAALVHKPTTAADIDAAQVAAPAAAAAKKCPAKAQTPQDADSDLEIVVCAKPIVR
jgi:hypothetical protein